MSNKREYPDRYGWWQNELASLGVEEKKIRNEINGIKELRVLTEIIKQTYIEAS
jgi:hypothetical protein